VREYDVTSTDGTTIRAWQAGSDGPPVLLCGGLGMVPEVLPALRLPANAVDAHGWYHRGTMGTAKPRDVTRIELADHVADAMAVLNAAGIERCLLIGWSTGVTIATELARRYPERVAGLLIAAGVPGDPFEAVLGVLGEIGVPGSARRSLATGGAQALRMAGPLLDAVLHRTPTVALATMLFHYSGLLGGFLAGQADSAREMLNRFLRHDWGWYFTLALAIGRAPRQDLVGICCPITVLAGRYDLLSDRRLVAAAAAPLPQARVRLLNATHLLPLEFPDVLAEELLLLTRRAVSVDRAVSGADPTDGDVLTRRSRPAT
jgi:pimeloyl-ACP methyl ester carboxylesterase